MSDSSQNTREISPQMWDRLAILPLVLTVLVSIYYVVVFISPSLWILGAKPEPEPIALLDTATPRPTPTVTDTPVPVVPTWTPTPTRTPIPTNTPRSPTPTEPSPTPLVLTLNPTETGTPTPTRHPYPFKLVEDGVQYTRYFFSSDCNWLGIAGEVHDTEGDPVTGIAVVLNGGGLQNVITYSGDALDYAESGWEHFLDTKPKEGVFLIQLWHQGQPVSEQVEVRTSRDCRRNLAYLVFEQVWEEFTP